MGSGTRFQSGSSGWKYSKTSWEVGSRPRCSRTSAHISAWR
jgi:hypothetical protein